MDIFLSLMNNIRYCKDPMIFSPLSLNKSIRFKEEPDFLLNRVFSGSLDMYRGTYLSEKFSKDSIFRDFLVLYSKSLGCSDRVYLLQSPSKP